MQNQNSKLFNLIIITPTFPAVKLECDSVHLSVKDGSSGKGGGSYGIRKGHAKAILALEKGKISAYQDGNLLKSFDCEEGFARVEKDSVTVVTEKIENDI
ncbi:MAG: hypothetical protein KBS52_02340 [Clostridiales bacterium]|nr:hypothetical protein [Candidatus Equinaster intestinalis]